jgi:hypothetical protein
MSDNRIAIILGVAGALIALVSLLADTIGLGSGSGFGPYQISGVLAGLLLLGLAVRRWRRAGSATVTTPTDAG